MKPSLAQYNAVLLVPTGIGASIGGYAGDALPCARLLAEAVDCLVTHPNVLNGAQLYWSMPNTLYVEGYALDQFAKGNWHLQPVHSNKVGLLLDRSIEDDLKLRHLQAAEATRATLGLSLTDYIVTDEPLRIILKTASFRRKLGHDQQLRQPMEGSRKAHHRSRSRSNSHSYPLSRRRPR